MVREVLLVFDNEYIFLCGDFNIVLNPSLDSENSKGTNNPNAIDNILEIMSHLQLSDYPEF